MMHQARWKVKAVYALKIFLFRKQVTLTVKEEKGITDLCLFVVLLYCKFWHEAPMAVRAPSNDLYLIAALAAYPDRCLADVALEAMNRHPWHLTEELV